MAALGGDEGAQLRGLEAKALALNLPTLGALPKQEVHYVVLLVFRLVQLADALDEFGPVSFIQVQLLQHFVQLLLSKLTFVHLVLGTLLDFIIVHCKIYSTVLCHFAQALLTLRLFMRLHFLSLFL